MAHALQKSLHEELERLIKLKFIAPSHADEKSEWCNSVAFVTKPDGTVRVCIYLSKLNDQIIHPVHNSRHLEDMLSKFAKAKYFSIFDVRSGYMNLEINLKSSYPTTFSYTYGHFRSPRLPFGLGCSSDIFQCKIDNLFHYLKTALGIVDDMIARGYREYSSDHNICAEQILQKCNEKNLKLNPGRCIMRCTRMSLLWFSKLGL